MSGSITTATGVHWSAAGWVFRNILDGTAKVLSEQGHRHLADLLSNQQGMVRRVEALALSDLSPQDRAHFRAALQICHCRFEAEGPAGWNMPDFFPGFMARFQALMAITSSEEEDDAAAAGS